MSGVAGQTAEVLSGPRFSDRGRLLTAAALAIFVIASVAVVAAGGLFLSRDVVFIWILVGLFAVSLSDINGFFRGVVTDWLPFFGALFVYDLLRGMLADSLFSAHTFPQIRVDEFLFGGQVPTVWLQERLFDATALQWYDLAAWAVYLTHFFAVFMIAAWLWSRARPRFRRFRNMVLTLTAAAFVTYLLFRGACRPGSPAMPAAWASRSGSSARSGASSGSARRRRSGRRAAPSPTRSRRFPPCTRPTRS